MVALAQHSETPTAEHFCNTHDLSISNCYGRFRTDLSQLWLSASSTKRPVVTGSFVAYNFTSTLWMAPKAGVQPSLHLFFHWSI